MKCMTVAGTRPEFIQTSRVSHAIRARHTEIFVNTGQHYDDLMSRVFFRELDIPEPDLDLNVGTEGAGHAEQTARIMMALEPALAEIRPDWVLVYGDTNTTVAAVLVAAKLHVPVVHIEAGLRSFDRRMPEEVNRVVADHVSQLLLAPTTIAVGNLAREGITEGVVNVGDVRVDVLADFLPKARARRTRLLSEIRLRENEPFALATLHRASNTDDRERLASVINAFAHLDLPVVLPVHPRLAKMRDRFDLAFADSVHATAPVGFLDMLALLDACLLVITDSGGLQKEAYMLRRPCVTVRDSTEWLETVQSGWNRLTEPAELRASVSLALEPPPAEHPDFYGTPGVGERIVRVLEQRRDAQTSRQGHPFRAQRCAPERTG